MISLSFEEVRSAVVDYDISLREGDVILLLTRPNTTFAIPHGPSNASDHPGRFDSMTVNLSQSYQSEETEESQNPDHGPVIKPVSYRVLRRSLCLASPYFDRMFSGPWFESTYFQHYGGIQIDLHEEKWDPEALLILLQMMHSRVLEIPRTISLDLLGKIVLIADYLACTDLPRAFLTHWWDVSGGATTSIMDQIRRSSCLGADTGMLTDVSVRETVISAFVSWKLKLVDEFRKATRTLVYRATGPIDNLELPFDPYIIESLNIERKTRLQCAYDTIFNHVSAIMDIPYPGEDTYERTRRNLDFVRFVQRRLHMDEAGSGYPQAPFCGYSLEKSLLVAEIADYYMGVFRGLSMEEI